MMADAVPAWSVIVPTYNRPERLAACVRALAAMRPPPGGFEIVIVNDGGIAPEPDIEAAAASGGALAVQLVTREHGGPAGARNAGAARARGQTLAFTDDDCEPATDWLLHLDAAHAAAADALIGGAVVNGLPENRFSEASQQLVQFVMDWFDGVARERFFTSNNLCIRRAAFHEIGGFDTSFPPAAEDREFCDRWHAAGRTSVREPRALVVHYHELGFTSFLRQHFTYGVGARSFRRTRARSRRHVRIDPGFYVASLQSALRARPFRRGASQAFWTGVAHAAYATGLASAALRGPWRARHTSDHGPLDS